MVIIDSKPPILREVLLTIVFCGAAIENKEILNCIKNLAENGEFEAVIDRKYSLEGFVEAHQYVDTGRKKGNVVITMQ